MTTSLETAPAEFIEAAGVRFAYRRLGPREGTPLVLLQHFTGTMDSWDPAVVNGLAENRPVIVFDNTGVGTSAVRRYFSASANIVDHALLFLNS